MPSPAIESLIHLQEADVHLLQIQQKLKEIPVNVAALEAKIAEQESKISQIEEAIKAHELRRKELDLQIKDNEAKVIKYKNQQLSVKKNEEYTALEHEISALNEANSTLEDEELELMLAIDEERESSKETIGAHQDAIADLKRQIAVLRDHENACSKDLDSAETAARNQRTDIPAHALAVYDRVRKSVKRAPWVTVIEEHQCRGCFLRVSNETLEAVRDPAKIAQCDNCQRILH